MTSRWMALLVMTRLLAAAVALTLLFAHRVTPHDELLVVATIGYTALSLGALRARPKLQDAPPVWLVDCLAVLGLVLASEDWRSPFYVYLLTALILPATGLSFRRAVVFGLAFTGCYAAIAAITRLERDTLESTVRLETFATHLMVPLVIVLALAYASEVLERLRSERLRSERLAVEAERQRIAWELHDSAKQRVHAAHLVLSALQPQLPAAHADTLGLALAELRSATADMDTSVAELRTPLEGRPVERMLRERAAELGRLTEAQISVHGEVGELPAHVAAHSYRIAAEAMTNAVRHSRAGRIEVALRRDDGHASIAVRDDGRGIPALRRPGSNGLRSMRARAETIGADLSIGPGRDGHGTLVELLLAADPEPGV